MKRLLFIYNPHAGRQKLRNSLAEILDAFAAQDYEITAYPTRRQGDATEAASRGLNYERVVCCGGDGTLNETITGLMRIPLEKRPVLGYIPAGTTNDFAQNLDLPSGIGNMAKVACCGKPKLCDLGVVEGRYFTYVAAFGLFTDVSYSTPQSNKNMLGHLAYVLEGAGRLGNIPVFHMKVETSDGLTEEGDYIYGMVGNTVSVGGLVKFPKDKVQLDDGLFEILLIHQPKNPKDWQDILSSLTTQKLKEGGPVTGFQASRVTFSSDQSVSWTLDGEYGGERKITAIENLPKIFSLACGDAISSE